MNAGFILYDPWTTLEELSAHMEAELLAGAIDIALEAADRISNWEPPQRADSLNLRSACQTQTDKLLDSAQGLLASYTAATEVKFRSVVYPRKKAFLYSLIRMCLAD